MVNGNPSGVTRSKDESRQKTIRPLDGQKMRYIDGMSLKRFGEWWMIVHVIYSSIGKYNYYNTLLFSFNSYSSREMGDYYC